MAFNYLAYASEATVNYYQYLTARKSNHCKHTNVRDDTKHSCWLYQTSFKPYLRYHYAEIYHEIVVKLLPWKWSQIAMTQSVAHCPPLQEMGRL